jgi:hypothetical protein
MFHPAHFLDPITLVELKEGKGKVIPVLFELSTTP